MEVRGMGRATFAAVLLMIAGSLTIIYGIAAISDAHFFRSLGIFALCVIVLHGLIVYGEPAEQA